ncbi:MAG: hypothetical protein C0631_01060 [Sedimenticola sp.]|nr:MAG: hypothetical protein C0631_01060 [Sedimenticola sp.]
MKRFGTVIVMALAMAFCADLSAAGGAKGGARSMKGISGSAGQEMQNRYQNENRYRYNKGEGQKAGNQMQIRNENQLRNFDGSETEEQIRLKNQLRLQEMINSKD